MTPFVTCTRADIQDPVAVLKQIISDPTTVVTRGSTFENRGNLSPNFIAAVKRKYEGTRLGRQELNAELLEDVEGALWRRSLIDALRVQEADLAPLKRIVVAIDPNASSAEDSNECGIICAGLGDDDHGYVLDDVSDVMAPNEWAREAISLLHARHGDRIVAERNNGGNMVEATLRMVDPGCRTGPFGPHMVSSFVPNQSAPSMSRAGCITSGHLPALKTRCARSRWISIGTRWAIRPTG
jgi:phage terminase large subunit-like protein